METGRFVLDDGEEMAEIGQLPDQTYRSTLIVSHS